MNSKLFAAAVAALLLVGIVAVPAAAAPSESADACPNAEKGAADAGPPSFVGGIVDSVTPDFLSDLFADLPVPGFVKGLFGAGTGC